MKLIKQFDETDCGAACLSMIIKYYKGYETKMLHNARDNKTTKSEKKRRSKLDIDNILGLDKDTDEE